MSLTDKSCLCGFAFGTDSYTEKLALDAAMDGGYTLFAFLGDENADIADAALVRRPGENMTLCLGDGITAELYENSALLMINGVSVFITDVTRYKYADIINSSIAVFCGKGYASSYEGRTDIVCGTYHSPGNNVYRAGYSDISVVISRDGGFYITDQ